MLASVVATIGLVPLGLGTFEATAVGLLHALGVGVETTFAATLMSRGLRRTATAADPRSRA